MQDQTSDGPVQPFLDGQGQPRIKVGLTDAGPVQYRPGEMIVDLRAVDGARDDPKRVIALLREFTGLDARFDDAGLDSVKTTGFARLILSDRSVDIVRAAEQVNRGIKADPDSSGPFGPNVVFHIGGLTAAPMKFAGTFGSDPMKFASDYGVDPMKFARSSTARPTLPPGRADCDRDVKGPGRAVVAILDTGFPHEGPTTELDIAFKGLGEGVRDRPDHNGDRYLDIAAGHSTFIRTIIERSSATVQFVVEGVMSNDGDGSESEVALALQDVFERVADKSKLVLNLSFSGYYIDDQPPPWIATWIRAFVDKGAVVVAAAGNDGGCRPKYPAAMPEVLSVGSVGPCGPSWFSNHGPWVDVCAPGEDIVSRFFTFDGDLEPVADSSAPDIDEFAGWAVWSGTSFSTPNVVGALCEIIELNDCTAKQALKQLVKRRGLFRIPDYGIVVNRSF